jgi:hypothetical protein
VSAILPLLFCWKGHGGVLLPGWRLVFRSDALRFFVTFSLRGQISDLFPLAPLQTAPVFGFRSFLMDSGGVLVRVLYPPRRGLTPVTGQCRAVVHCTILSSCSSHGSCSIFHPAMWSRHFSSADPFRVRI